MVEEIRHLREDFNKMLRRIEALEKRHAEDTNKIFSILEKILNKLAIHDKILEEHSRMLKQLSRMIVRVGATLGHAFEAFSRENVEEFLKDLGIIPPDAKLKAKRFNGGLEINIFLEDPLILGEVTSVVFDEKEVIEIINKILSAESILGRRAKEKIILISMVFDKKLAERIERLCKDKGFRLIIGKVVE